MNICKYSTSQGPKSGLDQTKDVSLKQGCWSQI